MYSLIGKQKWYWQALITVIFVVVIITGYLFARSWGYDKARKQFEAKDKVKAEQSAAKIARAEFLEQRVAELEPKLAAYEKLDADKKRLDGSITEKIDAVVKEGQKTDEVTNAPADCWTRADRTCAGFRRLKIDIDCNAYKQRVCANAGAGCR